MNPASELVTRLEIEPIRRAFPKEAMHFTTWLESHIEALAERVGVDLTVVQREKGVGDFNVDLLCEDAEGRPVIIENQLERTDHDHLGKLLTYLVNLDASTAIWVTTDPRPEHQKVIDWLNESTAADISFYLVRVEAIRIGNSPFAPLFTILSAPDRQVREFGEKKKEWAERHVSRYEFWKGLLEKTKAERSYSLISRRGVTTGWEPEPARGDARLITWSQKTARRSSYTLTTTATRARRTNSSLIFFTATER